MFKFQFERIDAFIGKHGSHVSTLDKYMSLENWIEIFNKLNKSVDKYVSKPDQQLQAEKIVLRQMQLELHISYQKTNQSLASVINHIEDDLFPFYFDIHVKGISRIDDYFKALKTDIPQSTKTSGASSSAMASGIVTGGRAGAAVEEYVPTPRTVPATRSRSSPIYTPARLLAVPEVLHQYTPEKLSKDSPDEFNGNAYRPSPIVPLSRTPSDLFPTSDSEKSTASAAWTSPRSRRRIDKRRGAPDEEVLFETYTGSDGSPQSKRSKILSLAHSTRSNISQDLFGELSDDGSKLKDGNGDKEKAAAERNQFVTKRPTLQRTVKNVDAGNQKKNDGEQKTPSVKGWLTKRDASERSTRRPKKDETKGKGERSSRKNSKTNSKKTDEERTEKEKRDASLERYNARMATLDALQEELNEMNKPVVVDRIM